MTIKDRVYKYLNPRGIEQEVDTKSLAQRLDTIDGKTICISSAEADPVIMPALAERLKRDYPNVNWQEKHSSGGEAIVLSQEEIKASDALIQGVAW